MSKRQVCWLEVHLFRHDQHLINMLSALGVLIAMRVIAPDV